MRSSYQPLHLLCLLPTLNPPPPAPLLLLASVIAALPLPVFNPLLVHLQASATVALGTGKEAVYVLQHTRLQPNHLVLRSISPLKSAASEKKETCAKAETVSETILKGTSVKTELTGDMGSASCQPLPAEVKCWNCDQLMTPDHQCDSVAISSQLNGKSPPTPPITSEGVVDVKLPPLPLCHYCCHRGVGSGPDNPGAVHYLLQCLCPDRVCSCQCYCTEEQMVHRVKFYPDGFKASTMVPVDPADRPRAKEIAEARYDKLCKWPCESPDCPR